MDALKQRKRNALFYSCLIPISILFLLRLFDNKSNLTHSLNTFKGLLLKWDEFFGIDANAVIKQQLI